MEPRSLLLGKLRDPVVAVAVLLGLGLFAVGFAFQPQHATSLIGNLAWPVTVMVAVLLFRKPLQGWLEKTRKMVLKIPGGTEIALEMDEARGMLQEVLDGIDTLIEDMSKDEKRLLNDLTKRSVPPTVIEQFPGFERSKEGRPNKFHELLRNLRRKHLIRPKEGSQWREDKQIEITPFGKLVVGIRRSELFSNLSTGGTEAQAN